MKRLVNRSLLAFTLISVCSLGGSADALELWSQGSYIWDSKQLLSSSGMTKELKQLKASGIDRLLVGLTPQQIDNPQTHFHLTKLIDHSKKYNQKVILLLGEPSWIYPSNRRKLLTLIKRFQTLRFDGLHLDLEVEQLGWPVPENNLRLWSETVEEVGDSCRWPLSISSHPRWFELQAEELSHFCVPCTLRDLDSVSIMVYTRNKQNVIDRARSISNMWPNIRFRVAQSVEAEIDPQESLAGSSIQILQTYNKRLRRELAVNNISGVDWQNWASYPKIQE